jgi:hypothetical protein
MGVTGDFMDVLAYEALAYAIEALKIAREKLEKNDICLSWELAAVNKSAKPSLALTEGKDGEWKCRPGNQLITNMKK